MSNIESIRDSDRDCQYNSNKTSHATLPIVTVLK